MNEKILQQLYDYLKSSEDFVLDQVPLIVQEALKYEKISTYWSIFLMIFLISLCIIVGCYFLKNPFFDAYGSRTLGSVYGCGIPFFLIPLFFMQLCVSLDKILKIYIAPKYYLLQLLSNLKDK